MMSTIEVRWNLRPLGTRDAAANDLSNTLVSSAEPPSQKVTFRETKTHR
jgi:hypothetical protein